jgi:hypothetical protein
LPTSRPTTKLSPVRHSSFSPASSRFSSQNSPVYFPKADVVATPEVTNVDVSDNRSTKDNIIMYGDCKNGSRFYMSEKEINEKINTKEPAESTRQKLEKSTYDYKIACEEIIKSKLKYPSTYSKSILNSSTLVEEHRIKILIGFTTKNAFNLKLKYRAICIFNDKPELIDFTMEEE